VLAPHADDESIGCGGTIAAKRAQGVRVVVVVATDGALSDRHGRAPAEVVEVRELEAVAACAELGVPSEDVRFLRFPDGALADHLEALALRLDQLVAEVDPEEILVSSALDPHPDHQAMRRAVDLADVTGIAVREYLVWAWPAWPLSARRMHGSGRSSPGAREVVRLVRRGRRSDIASIRDHKAAAIARYQSQAGDGRPGRGVPAGMLAEFGGGAELLLAGPDERRPSSELVGSLAGPGSRPRTWLRVHVPWLREAVLAPRRARNRRRWVRRHLELSEADRAVLTDQILPAVREAAAGADVLFVGVEWYTAGYPALFPEGNLVTMDLTETVAIHGASRHLTADLRELDQHFEEGSFAAIICNGVLGYGVDSPEDVRRALAAMRSCLSPDGHLVIGWNDTEGRRVPALEEIALNVGLEPTTGAGLATSHMGPIGPLRHIYDVYRRSSVS
jgi:LmbE family N-acetylglucosaminyl deacetylase